MESERPEGSAPAAASEAGPGPGSGSEVAFVKRRNRGNIRKKPSGEGGEEGTGIVLPVKRPNRGSVASSRAAEGEEKVQPFAFESSNAIQQASDGGATRALETETAHDRDARALREQVLAQDGDDASPGEAIYRGMNNYRDYRAGFRRENTIAAEKGGGAHGPLRGSTAIRMTVRVDYQPDICKDYKETGYCGYGDACKFLHDRGDYKAGYELDREWEEQQKRQREKLVKDWAGGGSGEANEQGSDSDESEDEDGLPFACYICREKWGPDSDPVVTRCGHYFCEHCALKENARTGKCPVCEQALQGIFNVAQPIVKKIREQQRAARA